MKSLISILIAVNVICFAANAATVTGLSDEIKSDAAILIDGDTGQILFEKNMHKKMRPASTTKVMTALLAMENGSPMDMITMSHDAVFSIGRGTSHIALDTGERLTLEQALYALAIASANDAANGIAEHIGGTMEDFAELMNRRAVEAGAFNTNFANAHGLSEDNHYTTVYDMARITMEAIKISDFSEIFTTAKYEMPPTNKQPEPRTFRSKNAMITGEYEYKGIIAGKTGWTNDSQHTLVTAAKRNGRTLIAVVMKSPNSNDKWEDTTALLDYGFDKFTAISVSSENVTKKDYILSDPEGVGIRVELITDQSFDFLIPQGMSKEDVDIKLTGADAITDSELRVNVEFALKEQSEDVYSGLGEAVMTAKIIKQNYDVIAVESKLGEELLPSAVQSGNEDEYSISIWLLRIVGFLFVVFILFIVFLIIRKILYIRNRRRRYKRY